MLIAVISDVHSNLEAFEAVLKDMKTFKPDMKVNLGDLVGYGPNPRETIALNQENGFITIKGNHDAAIDDDLVLDTFGYHSGLPILKHREMLLEQDKAYLKSLPCYYSAANIRFVHGSPPDSFMNYITTDLEDGINFDSSAFGRFGERVCFVGNTHCIFLFVGNNSQINLPFFNNQLPNTADAWLLENKKRYIINVGSVGQPRDGSPESKYFLFDTKTNNLTLRRVPYDFHKTMKKMEELGFSMNAKRLEMGR